MIFNRTFEGEVPKLTKWLYTSSGMFRDALFQFVSMFLLTFVQYCALGNVSFQEYLAMYGVISIIIIILRIWDGINDPIMGWLVEKFHFKWGKYRPWIFLGALTNSIVSICMFWVLPTGWGYVACFAVFYFLWDFTYTMNDIAFWSVLPSLSNKEKTRAKLTTNLSIFISVGTFAVGGAIPLLSAGNQQAVYQITAIVVSVLFFLSQLILVLFMKERKVDDVTEATNEKMKLIDVFKVMIKNKQLRVSIIGMLLFYLASGILVAAGLNYFYFSFGYKDGGTYQLIFTIVYAAATFAGQFLFPLFLNKLKMTKMKLFTLMSIITICAYVGLFCFVFFPNPATMFPLLCAFAFIGFIGQTIMSLILYIMIQDTIDYNEYKFKERRESAIFSLRAFSAKLASSIQQGILFLFLFMSSLLTVSNQIANWEREFANVADGKEIILNNATAITGVEAIGFTDRLIFHIGFTIVPMVLFLATFLLIKFKYKITEENHQKMVEIVEKRKEAYALGIEPPAEEEIVIDEPKKAKKEKVVDYKDRFREVFGEELRNFKDKE